MTFIKSWIEYSCMMYVCESWGRRRALHISHWKCSSWESQREGFAKNICNQKYNDSNQLSDSVVFDDITFITSPQIYMCLCIQFSYWNEWANVRVCVYVIRQHLFVSLHFDPSLDFLNSLIRHCRQMKLSKSKPEADKLPLFQFCHNYCIMYEW